VGSADLEEPKLPAAAGPGVEVVAGPADDPGDRGGAVDAAEAGQGLAEVCGRELAPPRVDRVLERALRHASGEVDDRAGQRGDGDGADLVAVDGLERGRAVDDHVLKRVAAAARGGDVDPRRRGLADAVKRGRGPV
jgi:hypothetical protein